MANEPITRQEQLLNAVASGEVASIEPITREEMFLAKLGGADVNTPAPITRKEQFLMKAVEEMSGGNTGGGGDAGGSTNMTCGTFKMATYPGSTTYEFEHGLGKRPMYFAIYTVSGYSSSSMYDILLCVIAKYKSDVSSNAAARVFHSVGPNSVGTVTTTCDNLVNTVLSSDYGIVCDKEKITVDMTEKNIYLTNQGAYYWVAMSEEAFG